MDDPFEIFLRRFAVGCMRLYFPDQNFSGTYRSTRITLERIEYSELMNKREQRSDYRYVLQSIRTTRYRTKYICIVLIRK